MGTSGTSHWSAKAAAELSGLSIHMLNYLERAHVLQAPSPVEGTRPHKGLRRGYMFGDIVMMRALCDLTRRGVSVVRLRPALQALRPEHARITEVDIPQRYLVASGEEATFSAPDTLSRDLDQLGPAAIVLDIARLRQEVLDRISGLKSTC
jgi:DNA-binding transcriptional MerR regulator